MADGTITFSTELDNEELEKELRSVKKKIASLEDSIGQKSAERLPLAEQSKQLAAELDIANGKLYDMQNASAGAFSAAQIKMQDCTVKSMQSRWNSVQSKVESYDTSIKNATINLNRQKEKAGGLQKQLAKASKVGGTMGSAMESAQKSMQRFKMRLKEVVRSALVFTVITQSLAKLRNWIGKVINTDKEATAAIADLKGALLTMAQPLVQIVIPAFTILVKLLANIITNAAKLVSLIFGLDFGQTKENAKNLYEESNAIKAAGNAAEKAKKQLAGFDEINQLSSEDSGDSPGSGATSGISPNFDSFDTSKIKSKMDEIEAYIAGSVLGLGAILAFSGVNIPLGIGLMAIGAAMIASEIAPGWNSLSEQTQSAIENVLAITGGVLLGIGAVLCFSGANIPLGIGLMAAGAVELASCVALSWESMPSIIESVLAPIEMAVGGAMLALGAMLCLSGASVPLGLAFLVAGASLVFAGISLKWDSMPAQIKSIIATITGVIGGAMLALGAMLAFSGIAIPLGIAFMLAGAVTIATSASLNWNATSDKTRTVVTTITAIVAGALIALGALLAFGGVNIPLGIGLMAAGAAAAFASASLDWDSVKKKIKTVTSGILAILSGALIVIGVLLCMSGAGLPLGLAVLAAGIAGSFAAWSLEDNPITRFVKKLANSVIGVINVVIDAINEMFHISFDGLKILGKSIIPAFDVRLLNIPNVPRLAKGAVIPPNREFMAVLGDQRHGTNVEAPLATIQQAVAETMKPMFDYLAAAARSGGGNIALTVNLDGRVIFEDVVQRNNAIVRSTGESPLYT